MVKTLLYAVCILCCAVPKLQYNIQSCEIGNALNPDKGNDEHYCSVRCNIKALLDGNIIALSDENIIALSDEK